LRQALPQIPNHQPEIDCGGDENRWADQQPYFCLREETALQATQQASQQATPFFTNKVLTVITQCSVVALTKKA
jgi:hypothetical protein